MNSSSSTADDTLVTMIISRNSAVKSANIVVVSDHVMNSSMETVSPTASTCEERDALFSRCAAKPATMTEACGALLMSRPRPRTAKGMSVAANAMTSTMFTADSTPIAPETKFSTSNSASTAAPRHAENTTGARLFFPRKRGFRGRRRGTP